jgi:hypothetical protein
VNRFLLWLFAGLVFLLSVPLTAEQALAIPAFARKYDLPCSMCHSAFPKLNDFGLAFRDNGFQMGGDKDNPVNQPAAYWPIAIRTPVGYLFTSTNNRSTLEKDPTTIRAGGFQDLGMDLLSFGTLDRDISYHIVLTVPGEVGLESAWIRLDKVGGTPLLNIKTGIFEMDMPFPTKRILTLTTDYPIYNFHPAGSIVEVGLGENQTGVELMGHEDTLGLRYSIAAVEGDNTELGKKEPFKPDLFGSLTYRVAGQRLGLFTYQGTEATKFLTAKDPATGLCQTDPITGDCILIEGTGFATRRFNRYGADLNLHAGPVNILVLGMTGMDPKQAIPGATRDGEYNGGFVEINYHVNPVVVLIGRYDTVKNTQQPDPVVARSEGDIAQWVLAVRYYLNISSRTDVALHGEYSQLRTTVAGGPDDLTKSTLVAFDFAF